MRSIFSGAFMALAAGLAAEPRALTAPQREMRELMQAPLMFHHLPKNAGTAIEHAGEEHNYTWGASSDPAFWLNESWAAHNWIFPTSLYDGSFVGEPATPCPPWHSPLR